MPLSIPRVRPLVLVLALGLVVIFLLSSTKSASFFPTLLPTADSPSAENPLDPVIAQYLVKVRQELLTVCPNIPEPIFSDPSLTPSQQTRYLHLKRAKIWSQTPLLETRARGQGRRAPTSPSSSSDGGRFMLTTNIRQIEHILPDVLNAILVLVHYLGPEKVTLSILEGPSEDCTSDALEKVLFPLLLELGVPPSSIRMETRESKIDFTHENRIEILAGLRNRALAPLWDKSGEGTKSLELATGTVTSTGIEGAGVGDNIAAVVFFNDVYWKAADVLELLHQHVLAGLKTGVETGMTTGLDWYERIPAHYYDIWVGRTVDTGDLFYPINTPYWTPSSDLFHNSSSSLQTYKNLQPFPAFASWNGMAVLTPTPFLPPHNVRFRRGDLAKGECAASECTLLCGDLWKNGWGRVQIIPSVQFAYERHKAIQTVDLMVDQQAESGWKDGVPPKKLDTTVEWVSKPPAKVRCHAWPEGGGLSGNVWEKVEWVDPWMT